MKIASEATRNVILKFSGFGLRSSCHFSFLTAATGGTSHISSIVLGSCGKLRFRVDIILFKQSPTFHEKLVLTVQPSASKGPREKRYKQGVFIKHASNAER